MAQIYLKYYLLEGKECTIALPGSDSTMPITAGYCWFQNNR